MVVTSTSTYHRLAAVGAAADTRPRRATQLGRCQRIAGVPLSSVYSNGSVGSYATSSTPVASRSTSRAYRSTYAATPSSRGSSIDRDLGSENLWKSEQYFSKAYPSYFSGGDHGVRTTPRSRAVSVDREAYCASPLYGSAVNYDTSSGGDNYDDQLYRSAMSRLGRAPSVPTDVGSSYASSNVGRVLLSRPVSSIGTSATRVARAASVTRVPYSDDEDEAEEEYYRRRRQRRMRASSLARYSGHDQEYTAAPPTSRYVGSSASYTTRGVSDNYSTSVYHPTPYELLAPTSTSIPRARASSVSRYSDIGQEYTPYVTPVSSGGDGYHLVQLDGTDALVNDYVNESQLPFQPDHVHTVVMPSGHSSVEYHSPSSSGSDEDRRARLAIQKLMMKTSQLEHTIPELEHYVRLHRDKFPEDTTIVQCLTFFRLKPEHLRRIGASPDADVYGVKQLEILVVPYGCNVSDVMSRYQPQFSQYKIEHRRSGAFAPGDVETMTSGDDFISTPPSTLPYHYSSGSYSSVPTTTWLPYNYSTTATPRVPTENYSYKNVATSTALPPKQNKVQKEYERCQAAKVLRDQAREVRKVCRPVDYVRPASSTISGSPRYTRTYGEARQTRRSSVESLPSEKEYRKRVSVSPPTYKHVYTSRHSPRRSSITSLPDIPPASSVPTRRRKHPNIAPQFTSALTSKRCNQGQNVCFSCSLSNEPTSDVLWFKGHRVITEGNKYHISNKHGLLSLEIVDVVPDDAGLYSVKTTNADGEAACSASLDVYEPAWTDTSETTRKPWFIVEVRNQTASLGDKVTLEARGAGKPLPTFTWFRDNNRVQESDRIHIMNDQKGNTQLVIKKLEKSDLGLYCCTAASMAGQAKTAATLHTIEQGQPTVSEDRNREMSPVPLLRRDDGFEEPVKGTKPWFIQTIPSEMTVHIGDPLTLNCIIDGDPKPLVKWQKGVRELTYSKRHRVVTEGNHYTMQIRSTIQTDSGQYIAVAENIVGHSQSSCWVNLLPRRTSDDEDMTEIIRSGISVPKLESDAPYFVKKLPHEEIIKEGDSLKIECRVTEAPREDVNANVDVKLEVAAEKIDETVATEIEGTTEITTELPAEEKMESETTEATFSFDAPVSKVEQVSESAETTEAMEMIGEASPVSEPLKEEKPAEESSKEVKKETKEEPAPEAAHPTTDDAVDSSKKKKHKKKETSSDKDAVEEPVAEEKVEMSAEKKKKKKKSEKLEEVSTEVIDAAPQKVEAEKSAVVEVTEIQKTEETTEKVETIVVTEEKTETREVIMEKVMEGKEEEVAETDALVFDVPLSNVVVKAGEEAKLFVKVTSQPEPWVKWFRDGTEIKGSERYIIYCDGATYGLDIVGVTPEDTGLYLCVASNEIASCSCVGQVNIQEEAVSFTDTISACAVDEGKDAEFVCHVTGQPKITWCKGDEELEGGKNIEMSFDGGESKLVVREVKPTDAGEYSCRIIGATAAAACSATLVVKEVESMGRSEIVPEEKEKRTSAQAQSSDQDTEDSSEDSSESETESSEEETSSEESSSEEDSDNAK